MLQVQNKAARTDQVTNKNSRINLVDLEQETYKNTETLGPQRIVKKRKEKSKFTTHRQ